MHSNVYSFTQDDDGCYNCIPGMTILLVQAAKGLKRMYIDTSIQMFASFCLVSLFFGYLVMQAPFVFAVQKCF
jgi:hypothetical protein